MTPPRKSPEPDSPAPPDASPFDGPATPEPPASPLAGAKAKGKSLLESLRTKPKAGQTKERRPKRSLGKRESAAGDLGAAYGWASRFMPSEPAGKMMRVQAPYAGYLIDDAVAGTFADRLAIQPLVRGKDRFGKLGAVIGPPIIVMQIDRAMATGNRAQYEFFCDVLKTSLRSGAPYILEAIAKKREDDAKLAEVLHEMYPDIEPGVDPMDAMLAEVLSSVFGGVPVWTEPEPEPEEETVNA